MKMNRYPGPRSFTSDDRHLFFGREQEKQELYRLIVLNDIVVMFGESGTGKTSLLQAGVCPELEKRRLRPVFIRLNDTSESPEKQVYSKLREGGYLPADLPEGRTLWEYFSRFWYVDVGDVYTPVVVFDQFEELFTLYKPAERREFIAQFAAVANGIAPEGLPPDVASPPRVKFIFGIRSDFLYFLDELSDDVPAILRCRFQLRQLGREHASEAIVKPAGMPGDYASLPFRFSDAALRSILDTLGQSGSGEAALSSHEGAHLEIAAFQLQLVCRHLEAKVIRESAPVGFSITPPFYGGAEGIKKIIDEFYNEVVEEVPEAERDAVERMLARGLIRNGRRIMMEESALSEEYQVSRSVLDLLQQERLLNREARKSDLYYEISHDTLVKPILERFKKIEEEERARQLKEERRKRKVANLAAFFAISLSVIAIGASLLAGWQSVIAKEKAREAKTEKEKAERNAQEAIRQKNISDSLAQVAEIEKEKAVAAFETSRQAQINQLLSDARTLQSEKRFSDALRACDNALAFALTPAEKAKIAGLKAQIKTDQTQADFERNRDIGLSLKDANECATALGFLKAARAVRPTDPVVNQAILECEGKKSGQ